MQMERDDSAAEVEVLREKLDKAQIAAQKAIEEKDLANKEFERMLEKYDRCVNIHGHYTFFMVTYRMQYTSRKSIF
jgi:hypothetical protein